MSSASDSGTPGFRSSLCIDRPHHFIFPAVTHSEDLSIGDGRSGIASAEARRLPYKSRSPLWPAFEQSFLKRNAIAVGPSPLGPVVRYEFARETRRIECK